jgi:hypothetical protein
MTEKTTFESAPSEKFPEMKTEHEKTQRNTDRKLKI